MRAKTEEPTPRRLQRARDEGDWGGSSFAAQAAGLTVAVVLAPGALVALAKVCEGRLRESIASAAELAPMAHLDAAGAALDVVAVSAPLLAAIAVAGAAATVVQGGGRLAAKRLSARVSRLDPLAGVGGLVTRARLFAAARGVIGAAIVASIAARTLARHAGDLAHLAGRLDRLASTAGALASPLGWWAAIAVLGLGGIDAVVQRLEQRRRLRMTHEEVKRERREAHGDPAIVEARARARSDDATAPLTEVERANVLVVGGSPDLACALRYDAAKDAAPVVVASGRGELAARLLRTARDHGVPIVDDAPLTRQLVDLPSGEPIPAALYDAVAAALREAEDRLGAIGEISAGRPAP